MPIETDRLLSALSTSFPDVPLLPFHDDPLCPIQWPSLTYRATFPDPRAGDLSSANVRMVLLFRNSADRDAAQGPIGEALEAGPRPASALLYCRDRQRLSSDGVLVIGRENAIVVMAVDEPTAWRVEGALVAATATQ